MIILAVLAPNLDSARTQFLLDYRGSNNVLFSNLHKPLEILYLDTSKV